MEPKEWWNPKSTIYHGISILGFAIYCLQEPGFQLVKCLAAVRDLVLFRLGHLSVAGEVRRAAGGWITDNSRLACWSVLEDGIPAEGDGTPCWNDLALGLY